MSLNAPVPVAVIQKPGSPEAIRRSFIKRFGDSELSLGIGHAEKVVKVESEQSGVNRFSPNTGRMDISVN